MPFGPCYACSCPSWCVTICFKFLIWFYFQGPNYERMISSGELHIRSEALSGVCARNHGPFQSHAVVSHV